jgi:hypothetical protein
LFTHPPQAISANTTLQDNVCYNGPRAGINWNDGFGGGNAIRGNLVFNQVRETGDHGPFNSVSISHTVRTTPHLPSRYAHLPSRYGHLPSTLFQWDRQPYLTKNGVIDGYNATEKMGHSDASIIKAQASDEWAPPRADYS